MCGQFRVSRKLYLRQSKLLRLTETEDETISSEALLEIEARPRRGIFSHLLDSLPFSRLISMMRLDFKLAQGETVEKNFSSFLVGVDARTSQTYKLNNISKGTEQSSGGVQKSHLF